MDKNIWETKLNKWSSLGDSKSHISWDKFAVMSTTVHEILRKESNVEKLNLMQLTQLCFNSTWVLSTVGMAKLDCFMNKRFFTAPNSLIKIRHFYMEPLAKFWELNWGNHRVSRQIYFLHAYNTAIIFLEFEVEIRRPKNGRQQTYMAVHLLMNSLLFDVL